MGKQIRVTVDSEERLRRVPLESLQRFQGNFKSLQREEYEKLRDSIERYGFFVPVFCWREKILDGHQRLFVVEKEGWELEGGVPVVDIDAETEKEAAEKLLILSSTYGKVDPQGTYEFTSEHDISLEEFELPDLPDFDLERFKDEFYDDALEHPGGKAGNLSAKFGVPPFSVLDARQGYWQDRKQEWLSLGLDSGAGRKEDLLDLSSSAKRMAAYNKTKVNETLVKGTSIFDPVLCELAYRWFSPPGGKVYDPFAGGSVRGIVAGMVGRGYWGVDLSEDQVEANYEQGRRICDDEDLDEEVRPTWEVGDSTRAGWVPSGAPFDFVFSCPPYGDLEVYSDNERDLSNMEHGEFIAAYRQAISTAAANLKEDRFACFVVSDFRDKDGYYRNFVSQTIEAFFDAGLKLYNEAILVTAIGSLPIRAGRMFEAARKLGKTHQNVLIFCKGDAVKATEEIGDVDFGSPDDVGSDAELVAA